jgi:uncharacterized phage protein (TIGR02216 family)
LTAAAGETNEFPWDRIMAAGFGLLRLSPKTFWAMTPRELERAMSVLAPAPRAGIGRRELSELMRAFPDKITEAGHG